ncbi:hypothetical protein [Providencia heimbachae]|uniref:hypothetical protein n=1 Tax=Providencia heimbachae TaxID=333962 RepID=UPI000839862A
MTDKTRPAFPCKQLLDIDPDTGLGKEFNSSGMSLRDYFAAKCMQGDFAAQDAEALGYYDNSTADEHLVNRANFYYRMADAMLKARG